VYLNRESEGLWWRKKDLQVSGGVVGREKFIS